MEKFGLQSAAASLVCRSLSLAAIHSSSSHPLLPLSVMSDPAPACGSGLPASFLARLASLKGRLVLVTGGSGFLGGHIVQVLLQAGARVRVFDVMAPKPGHGIWKDSDPVEVQTGEIARDTQTESAAEAEAAL